MEFAKWEKKDNLKKVMTLLNKEKNLEVSSIPMVYDAEKIYGLDNLNHSLIIGTTGSGKTQTITLPLLETINKANESVIVNDSKTLLYETTNQKFKENGYNVINLNFDDLLNSSGWNPFDLPFNFYKEGNKDKSQDLIEELAFYLFNDLDDKNSDPFWMNSIISYFTGLTFLAFERREFINLDDIVKLDAEANEDFEKFKDSIDKKTNAYINLSCIFNVPEETRKSIFSIFEQKVKTFISKENLSKMMSKSTFDIASIGKEKTIVYVISGNSNNSEKLLPLFVSQVYNVKAEYSKNNGKINLILDDFSNMYPIKGFTKMLNYSKSIGITFTIFIGGFNDLKNKYGVEETEIIKTCFFNLIYLYSREFETLKEISKLCGKVMKNNEEKDLISIEELKMLNIFETIVLIPRLYPIRLKMLPYYEIKDMM